MIMDGGLHYGTQSIIGILFEEVIWGGGRVGVGEGIYYIILVSKRSIE